MSGLARGESECRKPHPGTLLGEPADEIPHAGQKHFDRERRQHEPH